MSDAKPTNHDLLRFDSWKDEPKVGCHWIQINGLIRYQSLVAKQMAGLAILGDNFFSKDYSSLVLLEVDGTPLHQIIFRDGKAKLDVANAKYKHVTPDHIAAAAYSVKKEFEALYDATGGYSRTLTDPRLHGNMASHVHVFSVSEGRLHSEVGPAYATKYGLEKWFQKGNLHREDGPAVTYPNGEVRYFQDGHLHRDDGPAIVKADGTETYAFYGHIMDKDEYDDVTGPYSPFRRTP